MKTLRRGRKFDHVDTEGSWAISYGDMITLLLSFFVLYFTVDHNRVRTKQLHNSLLVRLVESGVNEASHPAARADLKVGDNPGDGIDPTILLKAGAKVHEIGDQLVIEFQDVSFFPLGVVDLTKPGKEVLSNFALSFIPFAGKYDLAVRAFTDTRPVKSKTGRFTDNLELSALRSVAAMRILQSAGVPLQDMRIAGLGEFKLPNVTGDKSRTTASEVIDPLRYARKVILVIEPKRAERI